MDDMTNDERFAALDARLASNALVSGAWALDDRVCVLAALSPEALAYLDEYRCPATLFPPWFARLVTLYNDCQEYPFDRLVAALHRTRRLDAAGWARLAADLNAATQAALDRPTRLPLAPHDAFEACLAVGVSYSELVDRHLQVLEALDA